jgi:threonine/homoserine/homoserine lactone efflux protein
MFEAILSGAILGFALAFLVGPVFFMILGTSIHNGFIQAAALATGVMLSDSVYILITGFGSAGLFTSNTFKNYSGIAGGILLIVFGITTLLKKQKIDAVALTDHPDSIKLSRYMVRGFIMNSLNPFVLIFWIGVASTIAVKQFTFTHTVAFYCTTMVVVLGTDLLKAFIANKLKKILTATFLIWLNRISGIALIVYGVRILLKVAGVFE